MHASHGSHIVLRQVPALQGIREVFLQLRVHKFPLPFCCSFLVATGSKEILSRVHFMHHLCPKCGNPNNSTFSIFSSIPQKLQALLGMLLYNPLTYSQYQSHPPLHAQALQPFLPQKFPTVQPTARPPSPGKLAPPQASNGAHCMRDSQSGGQHVIHLRDVRVLQPHDHVTKKKR